MTDALWAPWRLAYIADAADEKAASTETTDKPSCFLCHYRDTPEADSEHFVVRRTDRVLTVLNRYPYNNGHLLVAPCDHLADLSSLDDAVLLELQQELSRMLILLKQNLNAEGFNVGLNLGHVAGAGLPGHMHWHIVPRWQGDTNFMPVMADVKVIPQSLQALYKLLTDAISAAED